MSSPWSSPGPPCVSVVLCVRNGAATVGRQLAALAGQELDAPAQLVVVDNGSSDGTRDIVDAWRATMPALELVDEPRRGVNRARNRGSRASRAPLVLLCDADDAVEPGWLRAMVAALAHADVVGAALRPDPDDRVRASWDECPQQDGLSSIRGREFAVGASLGFRRAVYDAIDGFDEAFEGGGDDVDFCVRAQDAGATLAFVPDARVRYTGRDNARALLRQRFGYGRGYQRLLARHEIPDAPTGVRARAGAIGRESAATALRVATLVRREQWVPYLAHIAHLTGEAVELGAEIGSRRPGPRRRRRGGGTGSRGGARQPPAS